MIANRRAWSTVVVTVTAMTGALLQPAVAGAAQSPPPQIRVNQVGYPSSGPKAAYVMLPHKVASVRFEVVTPHGVAYRGTSARDVGSWNSAYQAVYQLSFSGLSQPGQYRVRLLSPAAAVSPGFTIGDGAQLHRELVDNSARYFTSERDGPDVKLNTVTGLVPSRCGGDGQPAQLLAAHRWRGIRDSPDVDLDPLPLAVEPAGQMLPPSLDLSHLLSCFQPLVVSLTRLTFASEIHFARLVPVDDVADDVMHRLTSFFQCLPART